MQQKESKKGARETQQGIALVGALMALLVLTSLLAAHVMLSRIELATTRSLSNSARGFAVAEAGLNLRAEQIRQTFLNYNRPSGNSPLEEEACEAGNDGSGDFQCQTHAIGNHTARTYVIESPDNPIITTIPPGELYQNLNAQEYRYTVRSEAVNRKGETEAVLELRFKSRLVPLFQFVAFYDKDLEILPGPQMVLSGPVHSNGDLYLNANNQLDIMGQVTTAGSIFRGRKNDGSCNSVPIRIKDPANPRSLVPSCPSRQLVDPNDLDAWNGMIVPGVDKLIVPSPDMLAPTPGNSYWDKADLRLVLRLNGSGQPNTASSATGVEVRRPDGSRDDNATFALDSCTGQLDGGTRAVSTSNTFFNNRESKTIRMLEVDIGGALNCIHETLSSSTPLIPGKNLDEDSEGGLVVHFAVEGPQSSSPSNPYGVRIRNGEELRSTIPGAPTLKGITLVTDQALYLHGHYNRVNKKPAALLSDSFNVLSRRWNLDDSASTNSNVNSRPTYSTTINAAVLAGTDSTGGIEGVSGQSIGSYNGGLENYPRFHEHWSGKTLTYRGSFVSLSTPSHVSGGWVYGSPQYTAPNRDWDYDTDFNDAANLPPMTPRFVYLRQELFERDYNE